VVSRVAARMVTAIEGLRGERRSSLWGSAVDVTLALARAPQHYLRAQLVLLGSLAGGGRADGDDLEELATGLELLHLFMLVHDDVIDDSRLRRGRATVHVALLEAAPALGLPNARNLAIVVGNLLHVLAMRSFARADRRGAAFGVILDACLRTGVGQFEDIVGWDQRSTYVGAFRTTTEDKAAYQSFAAPFASGLLLANPDGDAQKALAWGRHMGVAMQGLDDAADLVGDPAITGKDNFRDIVEGRLSLALMILLKAASPDERAFLRTVIGAGALEPSDRVELDRLLRASSDPRLPRGHLRRDRRCDANRRQCAVLCGSARRSGCVRTRPQRDTGDDARC